MARKKTNRTRSKKTKKLSFSNKVSRGMLIIFALVFANIGALTLILTRAAVLEGHYESVELDQLYRINSARSDARVKPSLGRSRCLTNIARDWARYMGDSNKLAHSSGSLSFGTRVNECTGGSWQVAGENVGRHGVDDSVITASAGTFVEYMDSTGHRENILNKNYNLVGLGGYVKHGQLWTVQVFAQCNGCGGTWTQNPTAIGDPGPAPATRNEEDQISATHGDFNGDGHSDIFWYGPGSVADSIWYGTSKRTVFDKFTNVSVLGSNYIPIVGDFNGDGRSDIFWYGPGSTGDSMWYGGSSKGSFTKTTNVSVSGSKYRPIAGDFNGDGRDDIFWYAPGSTTDYIWYFNSSLASYRSVVVSVSGTYTVIPGDFNGDGRSDVFFYAPGSAADYVWYFTGSYGKYSSVQTSVNGSNYKPVPGNFDNLTSDGKRTDDIYFYAPGTEGDYIWYGRTNNTFYSVAKPVNGVYNGIPGDFDGDGHGDILWYGPTGPDYLFSGTTIGNGSFTNSSNVDILGSSYLPTP